VSDFFLSKSAQSKKTSDLMLTDPFLKRGTDKLYILTADEIDPKLFFMISNFIKSTLGFDVDYNLIYSLKFVPSDKELSKGLEDFFLANTVNLAKIIPEGSRIITLGRALLSITYNSDMTPESFYDTVWNRTSFYDNKTKSWVYPVDPFHQIFNKYTRSVFDNYSKLFFQFQLRETQKPTPALRWPDEEVIDVKDVEKFFEEHANEREVAWDLETSGFNYMTDSIRCITMSFNGIQGYFIRWKDVNLESLNKFFKGKKQIGANLKFDLRFLRHRGLTESTVDFDTLSAGHCLNEMRSNSLKTHAWLYTSMGGYEEPLKQYRRKYPKMNYAEFPDSVIIPYATKDAIATYRVYKQMELELAKDPLLARYFYKDVMPSTLDFLDYELEGIHVNWERVKEVGTILDKDIEAVLSKIYSKYGRFNADSPEEMGKLFEFEMKLPCLGRAKSGTYLTNKKLLHEWAEAGYDMSLFLEHSELTALKSTFVGNESDKTGLWKHRYPDGKLHGTFWVMLARSGRNRSSDPNLQNIPKNSQNAKLIRSMFKTPDDEKYYFSETDSAGLQLRIGATLSEDPVMTRIFKEEDGDLHSQTAFDTFVKGDDCEILINGDIVCFKYEEVALQNEKYITGKDLSPGMILSDGTTIDSLEKRSEKKMTLSDFKKKKKVMPYKDMRKNAKYTNFGFIFGSTATGFGLGTLKQNWTEHDCDVFINDKQLHERVKSIKEKREISLKDAKYIACAEVLRTLWFGTYPRVAEWIDEVIAFACKNGYVRSAFGARRLLPELRYKDGKDVDQKHMKNLMNIAVNSPVQNHEAVVMNRAQHTIHHYIKDNGLKSRVIGNIHDAAEKYIFKEELSELAPIIHRAFSEDYPENNGIPYEGETNIADCTLGEYWGLGSREIGLAEGLAMISVKTSDKEDDDIVLEGDFDE
jgi:DNA polymerase I-like protein with 3'-5' exonuclease and polymerase domains